MVRATSLLLLLAGVAMLVSWGVVPAESQATRSLPRTTSPEFEFPVELASVDTEVGRLADRLDRRIAFPSPGRDPFSYVARQPSRRVVATEPVGLPTAVDQPADIEPRWPTLVAIIAPVDAATFEAALSIEGDEPDIVKAGATLGAFVVGDISADAVVVTETSSGRSTRLAVR